MKINPGILKNSKRLRIGQTPWEAKLWKYLRGNRFYGFKFKRQVPIGPYIVDFCCHPARLVIELDGGQHGEQGVLNKDREKEEYLQQENYRLIRIWNNELEENLEGALETIKYNLSPSLSPHLGRGT